MDKTDIKGKIRNLIENRKDQPAGFWTDAGYRMSAVLVPLIDTDRGTELLFEVRASHLKMQPGDTCFPGGGMKAGETSDRTAVREACEELEIGPDQISLEAPLPGQLGPGSQPIWPWMGRIKDYEGTFYKGEVDHVFTVPLAWFMDNPPEIYHMETETRIPMGFPKELSPEDGSRVWKRPDMIVPVYRYGDEIIWGFTARVVKKLAEDLKALGQ